MDRFEKLWGSPGAKSYSQFLLELVSNARQANLSVYSDVIARNLRIAKEDVDHVDAVVMDRVPHSAV
jgi:hypothetical protein